MSASYLDPNSILISMNPPIAKKGVLSHLDHGAIADMIIIGAGPAGITAAIYAIRKRLRIIVLTISIGGQASISGDIENYTGFQFITGPQLSSKFEEHLRNFNLDLHLGEPCKKIEKKGNHISVTTDSSTYITKACIICTGATPRELGIIGERELWGRGVSTCTICDAPLYADRIVAVIGGGNSALDSALELSRFAKKVYVINKNPIFKGDTVLLEKVLEKTNVEPIYEANTIEIVGKDSVEGLRYGHNGGEHMLPVDGVFVEIGYVPNSGIINCVEKNNYAEIKVNKKNETSVAGIYAAGDVTDIPTKQIIVAAGEGAKAAIWASDYIDRGYW